MNTPEHTEGMLPSFQEATERCEACGMTPELVLFSYGGEDWIAMPRQHYLIDIAKPKVAPPAGKPGKE